MTDWWGSDLYARPYGLRHNVRWSGRRRSMHIGSRQAAGLAVMVMTLTGTAWGQDKPACDSKGKLKRLRENFRHVV